MAEDLEILLAGFGVVMTTLGLAQLLGPRCGRYSVTNDAVELIVFGRFRVWKAFFDEISDIEVVSLARAMFSSTLHLVTKPFGPYVILRKNRGLFQSILITPEDAEVFVGIIKAKVEHLPFDRPTIRRKS